jgi:hypothetical protein
MKPLPGAVQRAFPCAPDRLPERPWRTDMTPAKAAAHDAAYPLPHPGYRAGQVWAAEDGDSVVVVAISGGLVCTAFDEEGWRPSTFSRVYPYLMADPACPHLAPWSPCEGRP